MADRHKVSQCGSCLFTFCKSKEILLAVINYVFRTLQFFRRKAVPEEILIIKSEFLRNFLIFYYQFPPIPCHESKDRTV